MRLMGIGSIMLLALSLLLSCCSEGTNPSFTADSAVSSASLGNDRVQGPGRGR